MSRALVVGFGVTGRAVAAALVARGDDVVAVDDAVGPEMAAAAAGIGIEVIETPDPERLAVLVAGADLFVPTPGLPDRHPVFALAAARDLAPTGELDLAAEGDGRPCLAVTGTNGKTTVTELLVAILATAGCRAVAAGNTDVPLITAIRDPDPEIFVVEASSFRLAPTRLFAPAVGTWLNFAPDHLDVHRDIDSYERAKASVFERAAVRVGNADDPVVARHLTRRGARTVTFGTSDPNAVDVSVLGGELCARGRRVIRLDELWRALPHDVTNALAAVATLEAAADVGVCGRDDAAWAEGLRHFVGPAHRVALVAEHGGVAWYDDSKATTPHAVLSALAGFDSVVLVAGGRLKGVDLGPLVQGVASVKAVVGLGEAGPQVVALFAPHRPTALAADMSSAVTLAAELSEPGDVVLLSPACASFDQYRDYAERGDDFASHVHRLVRET